jgi:ubiquinone/menaquinone biosynthesis C-methylase UbiE
MQLSRQIRALGKSILGERGIRLLRRPFRRTLPGADVYISFLAGKRGLEIGGPSGLLSDDGPLRIYRHLGSLDNCLYSANTLWTGGVTKGENFVFHPDKKPGNQIICEATNLQSIQDASYEFLIASHCLEHVANPLRALAEWKRVLKQDGSLLLILPHKDGTFDWRRPTTPIGHMVVDFENGVGEDDMTHLPEILDLHDLQKDKAAGTKDQFRERCTQNFANRAMHQHVFVTWTAVALLDQAQFQIRLVSTFNPFHIIVLAQKTERTPDNEIFLGPNVAYRHDSTFANDRTQSDG